MNLRKAGGCIVGRGSLILVLLIGIQASQTTLKTGKTVWGYIDNLTSSGMMTIAVQGVSLFVKSTRRLVNTFCIIHYPTSDLILWKWLAKINHMTNPYHSVISHTCTNTVFVRLISGGWSARLLSLTSLSTKMANVNTCKRYPEDVVLKRDNESQRKGC